jgi:hypothetical protein
VENIENHPSRISDRTCVGLLWQNRATGANTKLKKLGSKRIDHTAHNYVYLDPDKIRYLMLAFGSLPSKMSSSITPISLFMRLVVALGTGMRMGEQFRMKSPSGFPARHHYSAGLYKFNWNARIDCEPQLLRWQRSRHP